MITEPILGNCGAIMPADGYLQRMRELATESGALLIFDEVLTGFRVGPGGAQDLFGIDPDLTVLAKAIGAGFPVAALGGRREVMEQAADGRTMHGGTYNSNMLVCAAVIAACRETGADGFYEGLNAAVDAWRRGWSTLLATAGHARPAGAASARCSSSGSRRRRHATTARPTRSSPPARSSRCTASCATRGVLIQPPQEGLLLTSAAHTDADIDQTLEVAADAMPAVAAALADGDGRPDGRTAMNRATGLLALAACDRPARRRLRQRLQLERIGDPARR